MLKNESVVDYLRSRRSVKVKHLRSPAPSDEELNIIAEIAARVPDHGKLAPFKMKVLKQAGQQALGKLCAKLFMQENPEAKQKHYDHEAARFSRAPLCIAVLYTPKFGKIPPWEQELAVGAMCMNLLHGAHGLGYAGQWLSEWPMYRDEIRDALGGGSDDKIAGFIYLGTPDEAPEERKRPALEEVMQEWVG